MTPDSKPLPTLSFKPEIQNAPLYRGSETLEMIRDRYGLDRIARLGANESPWPTSSVVIQAMQAGLTNLNHYPPASDEPLREALATYIGQETTADHFVTGIGGSDILAMIAQGFLSPGDETIICRPTYPAYESLARKAGAKPVYADLAPDFTYNPEAILEAVTSQTRLLFLCSPNNPTGSILKQDQLAHLMAALPEHVLVVTDEVYHHFNTDPTYADSLRYVLADKNIVIIHSYSKVFGLAGLRLGYGIARPEIATYIARLRTFFHLSQLTLIGGLAALTDTDHVDKTISLVLAEREKLYAALKAINGVTVWATQTNFLPFCTPYEAAKVAEKLLEQGIFVREMSRFYMPGCLRVSIGQPADNDLFISQLKKVLGDLASCKR